MEEKDTIDLRKYVAMARKKWYLYAASFVVFLALAITASVMMPINSTFMPPVSSTTWERNSRMELDLM